jgi:DNA-directed RNA polymerase beta subunit
MKIIVKQQLDEKGQPEEFTWDFAPLGDSSVAPEHLTDDGLPKKGTVVKQGMVLVGKLGRGAAFDPDRMPTALELHGLEPEELNAKYANFWTNTSCYATEEMEGTVENAYFETVDGTLCAIVEIFPLRMTGEVQGKEHVGTR